MKTVVCGMSGGVDSSVAAYLLKEQGYNVIGLFMLNWEETDNGQCSAEKDYEDVKRVCSKIGIPYYTVNFAKEYYERVFEYFLEEYKQGRTPNPDVLCNREIKFGPFLEFAKKIGADYIATGHYCKHIIKDGKHYLAKADDLNKDQSYFLCQLNQSQLEKVLFPLENIDKPKVREIAKKLCLSTAEKKDSTGICFIGERNFRHFLNNYMPNKKGDIKTLDGKKVGEHIGLMYYTIGQRRGLNLGGTKDGNTSRWFVVEKDLKNNILYVSHGEDKSLYSNYLLANTMNFIPQVPEEKEFTCFAKFRYRQPDQKVRVKILDDKNIRVDFEKPQRAITLGQFVVLYDEQGICLGGGIINERDVSEEIKRVLN